MENGLNSLMYNNMEAIAAVLLLDSDPLDNITLNEMDYYNKVIEDTEEHFDNMKSSAFRIKENTKMVKNKKSEYDQSKSNKSKKKYGYWLTSSRTPMYAERYIPDMSINDYKLHFGLSPTQIEKLAKIIEPLYVQGDKQKNLESFVLVGLSALATQKSFREIGAQMSRGKGHSCIWSRKFNTLLSEHFTHLIKWPKENTEDIELNFQSICGFPGVVGAFGACHIPLKHSSKLSDSRYKNSKGFYSLVLSATCDYKMCFTSFSIDNPANFQSTSGMSNDIIQSLMVNTPPLLGDNTHILAGSGYPLCDQILTPYQNIETLTETQILYNNKLEKTKMVISNSFYLLRERFKRLNVIDMMDFDRASAAVVSACILHNFAMDEEFEEYIEETHDMDDALEADDVVDPPCPKRDRISNSFDYSKSCLL